MLTYEKLLVENLVQAAREMALTGRTVGHREYITAQFMVATSAHDVLDQAGAYGVAGGVWYDYNARRLYELLNLLDQAYNTDEGDGQTAIIASEALELANAIRDKYEFN